MASYIHITCQRDFDSQALLDAHVANLLQDPVCRVNEGKVLTKGLNY